MIRSEFNDLRGDSVALSEGGKSRESRYKDLTWPKAVMLYKKYRSMNDPEMQRFMRTYEALKMRDKSKLKERAK